MPKCPSAQVPHAQCPVRLQPLWPTVAACIPLRLQAVLSKLESVVGLASVKLFVRQLMAQLQLKLERKEVTLTLTLTLTPTLTPTPTLTLTPTQAGLPVASESSLHMTFVGNPGTV